MNDLHKQLRNTKNMLLRADYLCLRDYERHELEQLVSFLEQEIVIERIKQVNLQLTCDEVV